jgi:hypothetical protein
MREYLFELGVKYLETPHLTHIEFCVVARNSSELVLLAEFDRWYETFLTLKAAERWREELETVKKKNRVRKFFHRQQLPEKEIFSDDEIMEKIISKYRPGFAAMSKVKKLTHV